MTNKELQEIKESVALCEAGGPYRRDMENLIQEIERLRAGLKFYADSIKLAKIIGSNKAWEISETARKLLEEAK